MEHLGSLLYTGTFKPVTVLCSRLACSLCRGVYVNVHICTPTFIRKLQKPHKNMHRESYYNISCVCEQYIMCQNDRSQVGQLSVRQIPAGWKPVFMWHDQELPAVVICLFTEHGKENQPLGESCYLKLCIQGGNIPLSCRKSDS